VRGATGWLTRAVDAAATHRQLGCARRRLYIFDTGGARDRRIHSIFLLPPPIGRRTRARVGDFVAERLRVPRRAPRPDRF